MLEAEARHAREAGDLPADRDPADVAFELHSLASGGSVAGRLLGDPAALDRTRAAMRRAIGLPGLPRPRGRSSSGESQRAGSTGHPGPPIARALTRDVSPQAADEDIVHRQQEREIGDA